MRRFEYIEKRRKYRPDSLKGPRIESYSNKAEKNVIIWPKADWAEPEEQPAPRNPYIAAILIWAAAGFAMAVLFFIVFKSFV